MALDVTLENSAPGVMHRDTIHTILNLKHNIESNVYR